MPLHNVQAVVLGLGGEAHLYPLTKLRSKSVVPIGGQFRLIDIPISNCIHSGITRIFVLTQFLSASLHRHLYRTYRFSIFSGASVEILATEETLSGARWCQGTADAVRHQIDRIRSREPQDVLILAGDHLYRMDYGQLVRFHRERGADVTLSACPVSAETTTRYGLLTTDVKGRIVAFRAEPQGEKVPEAPKSRSGNERPYLASMGVYLFRTDALASLLEENAGNDLCRHILPTAIASRPVYAYPYEGYWEDLSTLSAFYQANLTLTWPNPPFNFYDPQCPIYTRSRFLPPSRIDGCRLERTIVADGCHLSGADIEECVIGLRSVVRPGTRLCQVVMMGADFCETDEQKAENRRLGRPHVGIGHDTFIERAIIDRNARIGRGVFIGSHEGEEDRDEELYAVRDGIVIIPENAVIPDGMTICARAPDRGRELEQIGQDLPFEALLPAFPGSD